MTDLVAKMVELLKSRGGVLAGVAASDIYDTALPENFCKGQEARAAITVQEAPDTEYLTESPMAEMSYEVRCWGPTPAAARAVFMALHDGLRVNGQILTGVTVGGVKWLSAYVDGGGQPTVDELTGWEFVLCTVRALVRIA